ncbi:hypothetical protein GCM10010276_62270 [Streptomyces longisporus]|uniref:Uncharacterized protein n=1 Tax=Streptomyces longisporus TaxID=1948 RepID=A0ABN3MTC0_STRLO
MYRAASSTYYAKDARTYGCSGNEKVTRVPHGGCGAVGLVTRTSERGAPDPRPMTAPPRSPRPRTPPAYNSTIRPAWFFRSQRSRPPGGLALGAAIPPGSHTRAAVRPGGPWT